MKYFTEVVKMRKVPATFLLKCTICNHEISEYDWHFGMIKMNDHIASQHANEARPLDNEELYSRKPEIRLESF